ncbi:MAG: glycosyltransferase [Firmicutes bacterium]|nr:glycosyltransferase [Bacillota bacterium]
MKVLIQNRSNYLNSIAGDSIQLSKTKEYLEKLGVQITVSSKWEVDLSRYDLTHLFNIMPVEDTYRQYQNSKRYRKKYVLSTIYWDPQEFLNTSSQMVTFQKWWTITMPFRQEIIKEAALILPNSNLEYELLKKNFGKLPPEIIVPNAADRFFATAKPEGFFQKYRIKDFLLSVGRICQRKNQLTLIRVAKELNLPLVLIGPINDGIYYRECRRESAGHQVTFIDALAPLELASAYASARVHALISWYDTPGLVSLEAAMAGCKIVTTDRGSAAEYFRDQAFYCDPGRIESIRAAIKNAWYSKKDPQLKDRILMNYTWEKAAQKTFQAYQAALNNN